MPRTVRSAAEPSPKNAKGSAASKDAVPAQPKKVAQILPAARDLFLERGFEGMTMDMAASRAGVSKATLYVYFPSKEDLFAASIEEEAKRINAAVSRPFAELSASDEPIEQVLRKIARAYIDIFLSERTIAMQQSILGALPRFREIGRVIFGAGPVELTQQIADLLVAARDRGQLELDDPLIAAKQFMCQARGEFDFMGMLMLPRPDEETIERWIDASIDLFMTRYGKR